MGTYVTWWSAAPALVRKSTNDACNVCLNTGVHTQAAAGATAKGQMVQANPWIPHLRTVVPVYALIGGWYWTPAHGAQAAAKHAYAQEG